MARKKNRAAAASSESPGDSNAAQTTPNDQQAQNAPKTQKALKAQKTQKSRKAPIGSSFVRPLATAPTESDSVIEARKQMAKSTGDMSQSGDQSSINICRNKHWRYISSFHGPWLQLPTDVLESIATFNYSQPRPRFIDPAVLFDVVKIRKLVDEASDLAVRAKSNIVISSAGAGSSFFDTGPISGRNVKLSPERRHRMRLEATQRLARAYALDEIATSVAAMQANTTIDTVASLVLDRDPRDADAIYAHFFHQKIPSRQVAESTSLEPLDGIIYSRHHAYEVLRTRATVHVFKDNYEAAVVDLTEALQRARFYGAPGHASAEGGSQPPAADKQPTSIVAQLLFQRGNAYLALACQYIYAALGPEWARSEQGKQMAAAVGVEDLSKTRLIDGTANETTKVQQPAEGALIKGGYMEARKLLRVYAKRALRDYLAYVAHYDYSPNVPIASAEASAKRLSAITQSRSGSWLLNQLALPSGPAAAAAAAAAHAPTLYAMNELFSPTPPADLPPFPAPPSTADSDAPPAAATVEVATYHPLLIEALHSILLAHTLLLTSPKEMQRHAYMVARIASFADAYPVFQSTRSPARTDWVDVLRGASGPGWIEVNQSWESLCAPPALSPSAPSPSSPGRRAPSAVPRSLPPPQKAQNGDSSLKTRATGEEAAAALQQLLSARTTPLEARKKHATENYEIERKIDAFDAVMAAQMKTQREAMAASLAVQSPASSGTAESTALATSSASVVAARPSLPPAHFIRPPVKMSERAVALRRWLHEGMRLNGGTIATERKNKKKSAAAKAKTAEAAKAAEAATSATVAGVEATAVETTEDLEDTQDAQDIQDTQDPEVPVIGPGEPGGPGEPPGSTALTK